MALKYSHNDGTNVDTDPNFILNEKNTMITTHFLNQLFKKYNLNHEVSNMNRFITAMTHTSYCLETYALKETQPYAPVNDTMISLQNESYERLEFLGDSIIHTILAEYIFVRFSDQQEGFMTKLRTKLENSETLAKFSLLLGFDKYVLISRYTEDTNGRCNNTHLLEDVFEAFIGALFLDIDTASHADMVLCKATNFELCRKLIIQLIECELDISEILCNDTNYKDMLLQYAHKKKWPDPIYGTQRVYISTDETMITHPSQNAGYLPISQENKMYEMFVKIKSTIEGVGCGNSKKKGEQMAAEMALKKFGVLHDDSDCSDDEYFY